MKPISRQLIMSVARIAVLLLLGQCGLILLMAEADDTATLLLSKALALGALYGFYLLYRRWAATDRWLGAFDRWSGRGCEPED